MSFLIADCSGVASFINRINRERISPIPGPPRTRLISDVEPPLSLLSVGNRRKEPDGEDVS
jgi:hypothetical protein